MLLLIVHTKDHKSFENKLKFYAFYESMTFDTGRHQDLVVCTSHTKNRCVVIYNLKTQSIYSINRHDFIYHASVRYDRVSAYVITKLALRRSGRGKVT